VNVAAMAEMGNPFIEQLLSVCSWHDRFHEHRHNVGTVIWDSSNTTTLLKNSFWRKKSPFLSQLNGTKWQCFQIWENTQNKENQSWCLEKRPRAFFSRLYMACQTRGGNLQEFLRFENQPWSPPLAHLRDLRSGSKADFVISLTT
jgi:hypothetical protein